MSSFLTPSTSATTGFPSPPVTRNWELLDEIERRRIRLPQRKIMLYCYLLNKE
jgi:hypothetical protein